MSTTIAANQFEFAADLVGSERGELVLFLHGFPQTRHTWRAEIKALAAQGYRCCAYDQRGYSPGARPDGIAEYLIENLISDVLAIAEALGHSAFHLVGHDWGGQLAWCTAALHPDRVQTLSVISRPHPAAFLSAMTRDPKQAERSGHHRRFQSLDAADDLLADNAATLRKMYVEWGGVPVADAQAYLAVLGDRAALDSAIHWYRAVGQTAIDLAQLPAISMPTLYVWGTADSTVGAMAAQGTAEHVLGPYDFRQIPEIGHFVTDEAPGVFTQMLIEHLTKWEHSGIA